ncbi:MAG: amidohydrolase family protein [Flavobacteriales bacterium]|nr:amidohydrolase family protein [Flavobacteriales bacterium]
MTRAATSIMRLGLFSLALVACTSGPSLVLNAPEVIIRHINVVDVERGVVLRHQLIAMREGAFTYVGDDVGCVDTVPGARYVDGTGLYAMPGLFDMHVHVCWSDTNATLLLPVLLSHGITGVRDMGGDLRLVNAFKQRVLADATAGPEIWGCGPILDGDPPVFTDFTVPMDSTTDMPRVLDSLATDGVDFFKVYSLLEVGELERIAAYCAEHNTVFAGHLSELVEPERAIALGQHSVEHLNRLEELWSDDPNGLDSMLVLMKEHEAWSCPTLIVYHRKAHMNDPAIRDTSLDAQVPGLQAEWEGARAKRLARYGSPAQLDSLDQRYRSQQRLVRHMHEQGVRMMAGSDLGGAPFVYPGTGLLEEMERLAEAGLPNAAVLRMATTAPATYLGVAGMRGTVAVGQQADLVLLRGNPLDSIGHIRSIAGVFHRARLVVPIED